MEATVAKTGTEGKTWGGGNRPLKASYGKMMMWFFIVSDALTFSGFLASYGFSRFKFVDAWPIADQVFTHFPFLHGVDAPMYYVAFMTFVLIFSSVTMVLAVDAGHKMQQEKSDLVYVLYHHWRCNFRWFTGLGMGNLYKRRLWCSRNQRWKNTYSFWIQKENELLSQILLQIFLPSEQEHAEKNGVWFRSEPETQSYLFIMKK